MSAQSHEALLIIAASESCADLYYATRFLAPDAFIYLEVGGRTLLLMSDLELDRAKAQSRVDEVLSYSRLASGERGRLGTEPTMFQVIAAVLRARGISRVIVPASCGIVYVEGLRKAGVEVRHAPDPFFPQRVVKTAEEIAAIEQTQRHTEVALAAAVGVGQSSLGLDLYEHYGAWYLLGLYLYPVVGYMVYATWSTRRRRAMKPKGAWESGIGMWS